MRVHRARKSSGAGPAEAGTAASCKEQATGEAAGCGNTRFPASEGLTRSKRPRSASFGTESDASDWGSTRVAVRPRQAKPRATLARETTAVLDPPETALREASRRPCSRALTVRHGEQQDDALRDEQDSGWLLQALAHWPPSSPSIGLVRDAGDKRHTAPHSQLVGRFQDSKRWASRPAGSMPSGVKQAVEHGQSNHSLETSARAPSALTSAFSCGSQPGQRCSDTDAVLASALHHSADRANITPSRDHWRAVQNLTVPSVQPEPRRWPVPSSGGGRLEACSRESELSANVGCPRLSVQVDTTGDDSTVFLASDQRHNPGDTELSAASAADTVLVPRPTSPRLAAESSFELAPPSFAARGGRSASERRALWQLMAAEQPHAGEPSTSQSGFSPSAGTEAQSCVASSATARDALTAFGMPPQTTPRATWAHVGPLLSRAHPEKGPLS